MPLFAIQWGLIVACALSSVTGLSGVVNPQATLNRFFGENFPAGDIYLWNTKMQFLSLLVVYSLNLIVALYCPYAYLAYMLAAGNMIRVLWIVVNFLIDAEKLAYMGFAENGKMLKVICAIQSVLAVVIAATDRVEVAHVPLARSGVARDLNRCALRQPELGHCRRELRAQSLKSIEERAQSASHRRVRCASRYPEHAIATRRALFPA